MTIQSTNLMTEHLIWNHHASGADRNRSQLRMVNHRYTEISVEGGSRIPSRILEPTGKERARQILIFLTTVAAIGAACMVLAGYGAKPKVMAQDYGLDAASAQYSKYTPSKTRQSLDDDAPPAEEGEPKEFKFETPDPEEAKKKAAEAANAAGEAASKAAEEAQKALMAILPVGDIFNALGWHIDFCVYLATMYAVYYVWKTDLHWKLLPRFEWAEDTEKPDPEKLRLDQKKCDIKTGWVPESEKGKGLGPNMYDLLWFRLAKGEELHFSESKRVLPGFVDTLMCGCGGNVFALGVTSKRIIIQNDKRCLFGTTVLTTNEESYFLKDIHKASLHTDGALNLGICVLHSAEMLRGGFNWIFFGFIIDIILEWKPALLSFIDDERLLGWINMVPNDVIHLIASLCVIFGGFLFVALLWFLLVPQSTLEIEFVKQAGTNSYFKKYDFPVLEAYKAYDAIMSGRCDKV